MTAAARDSDTPEYQLGDLLREVQGLRVSSKAHADEVRGLLHEQGEQTTKSLKAAFARIDGLKKVLEADRAERDAEREQLAALVEAVEALPPAEELTANAEVTRRLEAVEATDADQEDLRKRVAGAWKALVVLVPLVWAALGSLAGWQLHSTYTAGQERAELKTRVARAEDDVQRHGSEDDAERAASRRERTETARALERLTGAIEEWQASQAAERARTERQIEALQRDLRRYR